MEPCSINGRIETDQGAPGCNVRLAVPVTRRVSEGFGLQSQSLANAFGLRKPELVSGLILSETQNQRIPNALIRELSVVGFMPSFAAAPSLP